MASPQIENGYTKIANELLEKIIASSLNGTEIAVILFVIRKTYGYQKKEDEISLSQFMTIIPCTKPTICTAIKNLQLVKILKLVKKGNSKICSNLWTLNKNYETWQLVKKYKLVKVFKTTSKGFSNQLVKKPLHTKENTKENTKERNIIPPTLEMVIAYCQERKNTVDGNRFINYYSSNGWLVGKNKMKDWQAAVRNWEEPKKDLTPEQEARQMVKELGANIASFRFQSKYGDELYLKYRLSIFEGE